MRLQPHHEERTVNILAVSLCLVSLLLMFLPLSRPARAFRACLMHVFEPMAFAGAAGTVRLAEIPARAKALISADIENLRLKDEIAQVDLLKAELASLRAENERLAAGLGLARPAGRQVVWARVMERDPITWYHSVMVDAGAEDGIALNAAVLAHAHGGVVVVGRVSEVGKLASKVLLVTDELSSVAAYLSTGTAEGLVQGQGNELLRMEYIHSKAKLVPGDTVVTSATSATFPAGLAIGTVAKASSPDPFLTFQTADVIPAADPASIKEVMILR